MSEQKRKQTFKLIIGAGLEFSFTPGTGVKLRLLKPDFKNEGLQTSMPKAEALSVKSSYSEKPDLQSKEPAKKGSIIDIYC